MASPLRLTLTDYLDATRWRWVLSDNKGAFLADHVVQLNPTSREYAGFRDLRTYLDYNQPISSPAKQLEELGAWIGEKVFGPLRDALWKRRALPALPVQLVVPEVAQELLVRPFELARFANGKSFREAGVRFVYQLEDALDAVDVKEPAAKALRILAAFSLPARANPLNLRRERYQLQQFVRGLSQTQGLAVELRVLQYGATRETLQDALEDGEGWDIIHLSGHGNRGELLMEKDNGDEDSIDAEELGTLLEPARARLKLLLLDACYTGVGSQAAARAEVGFDSETTRQQSIQGEAVAEAAQTTLPSLAQSLSQQLDCATVAMRYPVGDAFATELMLALYEKLLDRRQPLPAALHLALNDVLATDGAKPPLSPATPILVGARAADLKLVPPARPAQGVSQKVGLDRFPREPERFVGRLQPMLRASQALAPRSAMRGVLFYGMPGAGKTACALELAYRHEQGRFAGYVWYKAPEEGTDISSALFNLMQDIQTQLKAPDLGLTTGLDDPAHFRSTTLPDLRALLQQNALLLVLDNLETLLTDSNNWRDPLWGELVNTLLSHNGPSRVVLTSRRPPADLTGHTRVLVEPIHALSFPESVLLARELPNLQRLFADDDGLALLRQTLRVAQGNPKLLELADGVAADRQALSQRVTAAANDLADKGDVLDAFFAVGVTREGETRQSDADFVRALQEWTTGVVSGLKPTAQLFFAFLCRMEPEDRRQEIVAINWKDFLTRLGDQHAVAVVALAAPQQGWPTALAALQAAGLVAVERPAMDDMQARLLSWLSTQANQSELDPAALLAALEARATFYTIHPGVAEAARAAVDAAVLDAADIELGDYHIAMVRRGRESEMEGGGQAIIESGRRAQPYLLRQARWNEASTLLEQMLHRDSSPDSVAFALPLLRRIVAATVGTERELIDAGRLASTLWKASHVTEAEQMLRDIISRSAVQRRYRLASNAARELLNLLRSGGRLQEALLLAEEIASYTRRAKLGPWTQLGDECSRLQVLNTMGRYDEVLDVVEQLRPQLDTLPLQGEAEETVNPWNVREILLDAGREAAMQSERWEMALTLNAEILALLQKVGAGELKLVQTRYNDYGPLLRLRRYDESRTLLLDCRAVFEKERYSEGLGKVYSALADLEHGVGDKRSAVRFEEVAIGYRYQVGQPGDCAISHYNLSIYLDRQGANASTVLAHRLAAATIILQMQSGQLTIRVRYLALSELPPSPPTFASIADQVEAVPGVRFRALFERLPRTVPDGDAAIAAVWQLVIEERARQDAGQQNQDEDRQRRDVVLASLPAAVQAAFALEGEEFGTALQTALADIPEEKSAAILQQLREADLINSPAAPNIEQALREFEPLLQAIAAAVADESQRGEIEATLAKMEQNGWMLRQPVARIWAGERDAEQLTVGLDEQDSALVRHLLNLLKQ